MPTRDRADLVVVGGGLAAVTAIRAMRRLGDERSVILVGSEDRLPYDRPPLSKQVLTGDMTLDECHLLQPGEHDDLAVDLRLSCAASALSPKQLAITLVDGTIVEGDDILIATGSRPRVIEEFGRPRGLHYLRRADDAERLREDLAALGGRGRVVVIGAGFIGLEVAAVARTMGLDVTVLEAQSAPLERVLGPHAGTAISQVHRDHGVDLRCDVSVTGVIASGGRLVVGIEGSDEIAADVVVVGIGVKPCVWWLHDSGVAVDNGVVCDSSGRSSRAGVWAAGDCARWPNVTTGLHVRVEQWQAALDQAMVVGENLVRSRQGEPLAQWTSVPYFWSDQFDLKIQFAGHPGTASEPLAEGVIGFRSGDAATGFLVMGNPRLLARGRKVIAAKGTWADLRALV